MDFVEIEILNWEKYNPRRDYKKPWWFALSNTITTDDSFSEFSDAEFKAWIHILCTASVQNKNGHLQFFFKAAKKAGIKREVFMSVIEKLKILKTIRIQAENCTDSVRDLGSTLQNRTIQNNTKQDNAQPAVERDFDLLYRRYPRKQGKAVGLRRLRATVKTQADWIELNTALDNFLAHHKRAGTEAQFIPHFSTFATSWRDWLDPDAGRSESFQSSKPLADIDLDGGAA